MKGFLKVKSGYVCAAAIDVIMIQQYDIDAYSIIVQYDNRSAIYATDLKREEAETLAERLAESLSK